MSERLPRVAAVDRRDGMVGWTRWFIEQTPVVDDDRPFVLVGGPEREWSLEEVYAYGEAVRWYRLEETDEP